MDIKTTNVIVGIAQKKGRNYITPEDVGEAVISQIPEQRILKDLLEVVAGMTLYGVEDPALCAFVAINR
jgi:hypothetical protein